MIDNKNRALQLVSLVFGTPLVEAHCCKQEQGKRWPAIELREVHEESKQTHDCVENVEDVEGRSR